MATLQGFYAELWAKLGDGVARQVEFLLSRHLGGKTIKVPTMTRLVEDERNRHLRNKFQGDKKELARYAGLSERQISRILGGNV